MEELVIRAQEGRLIQASLELFSEVGILGVTTQTLARKAGIRERDLVRASTARRIAGPSALPSFELGSLRPAPLPIPLESPDGSLRERLVSIVSALLRHAQENQAVWFLIVREMIVNKEYRAACWAIWTAQHQATYRALVETARSAGELRSLPDDSIVGILASVALGRALVRILSPSPAIPAVDEAENVVDFILDGMRQRTSPPGGADAL